METLNVPRITDIDQLKDIPAVKIANNNWPEYPKGPDTEFKIALLDDKLCVAYTVKESSPRAVNHNDQEPVWEDSCVEFFCRVPGDPHYFNLEFNSLGTCVASRRLSRKDDVQPLSEEQLIQIRRCPVVDEDEWNLMIEVPLSLILPHNSKKDEATEMIEANFYKCGDKTDSPHFMSWSPIDLPAPDFHCPAYFGQLHLPK